MKLHELTPAPGSRRPRKRVGRGIAAGQGKTSGRGQKGQGARSSVDIPRSFEGGQMPLAQRLPKLRGFTNINRKEFAVVNLAKLNRFEAGTEVNPQLLTEVGLVRKQLDGIKILAAGEIKVALKVAAHRVSASARKAIEAAGGSVELLGPQPGDEPEGKGRKRKKATKPAEGTEASTDEAPATAASAEPAEARDEPAATAEVAAEAEPATAEAPRPAPADEAPAESANSDAPEGE